jgi:chromosome segregation ATPase
MVSDKNTKQEILEEYKKLVAEVKSSGKSVPRSASGFNSKNNKADIISAIDQLLGVLNGVLNSGATAPAPVTTTATASTISKPVAPKRDTKSVKKEDNDLSYLNQEILEKIEALNSAKTLKKEEYNNILAVEQELVKFVGMINQNKNVSMAQEESQADAKLVQEENIKQLQAQAEESIQDKLNAANDKVAEVEDNIQKNADKVQKDRAVEEEAYTYQLNKEVKEEDDAWDDVVAKRKYAISQVEVEIANLQAEIDSKADLVVELNAKLEEVPTLIEQAKVNGAEQKEKELGREYGYKSTMSKKDSESTIQQLKTKIANIEEDYQAVLTEKQSIQEKLDKAYDESNKLYMQTVQSTGGVKILNNSDKN